MLKEETKIEVELSGEIDSSQDSHSQAGSSKASLLGGMSLPVPVNISQPAIKEWFGKRRANIRPLGEFFNTSNFQVPPSAGRLTKRLYKNVEYFQSNYVMVFIVLVLYCLISSPLLLIVIAATGGACYIAGLKNADRKLSIAGKSQTQTLLTRNNLSSRPRSKSGSAVRSHRSLLHPFLPHSRCRRGRLLGARGFSVLHHR